MPSAMSSPSDPDGTEATSSWRVCPSLRRMIAPLPYSFSTLAMASSREAFFCLAFFSFLSSLMVGDLCCPAAGTGRAHAGGDPVAEGKPEGVGGTNWGDFSAQGRRGGGGGGGGTGNVRAPQRRAGV